MSRCACAPLIFFDKFGKVNPSTKNISDTLRIIFCSSSVGNVYVGRLFSYWTSGSANMSSDCKIDDADSNSIHASPAAACKETCGRERLIGCTCIVRTGPEHDQLMERTLTWAWQRSMGNSCEAPPGTGQHIQSTVPTQKVC